MATIPDKPFQNANAATLSPYGSQLLLEDAETAPTLDGLEVRALCSMSGGSMAHFVLPMARVSLPCKHGNFSEIWFVLTGTGKLWRSYESSSAITTLKPGMSFSLTPHTTFQIQADDQEDLAAIAVTIPAFDPELVTVGKGIWPAGGGDNP